MGKEKVKRFYLSCIEHPKEIFSESESCTDCEWGCEDSNEILSVRYLDEEYNYVSEDIDIVNFILLHHKTLKNTI